ncbi:MAG: hypothetical protein HQL46_04870 [Gammaproteobacteria bacterium]|nr:hypothetical protein [Gammaproteobacteria bacterium]
MNTIKILISFSLALYGLTLTANSYAGSKTKDKLLWDISIMQIKDRDWNSAEKTLQLLKRKYPDNQVINNLLSVIFFNQGRTEIAQELLVDIIESNKQTKIAYYNLKKIFSYSAAKTYSKGLQLMTPVEKPVLEIDDTIIEFSQIPLSKNDMINNQKEITERTKNKSE